MPTYEYERSDGTRFQITQKITDDALTVCPDTGLPVQRIISATAFHLKGSGWYKTDYAASSSSSNSSSTSSSGESSESSVSTSSSSSNGTPSEGSSTASTPKKETTPSSGKA